MIHPTRLILELSAATSLTIIQHFAMSPDIPLNLNPKLPLYLETNRNLMFTLIAKN